jgi:hypothetical protein
MGRITQNKYQNVLIFGRNWKKNGAKMSIWAILKYFLSQFDVWLA